MDKLNIRTLSKDEIKRKAWSNIEQYLMCNSENFDCSANSFKIS